MCGICGAVSIDGPLDPTVRDAVPHMTMTLQHRGPDGGGLYGGSRAVLGHRRLAIIDRAGGGQPMANEDESCWIVFNGEIYNHRGLQNVLAGRGHRFRTCSDTEAILHAYEEYGTACVDHLDGMFAFAIYDARRHEFFAARDRLGKKPLYYALLGGVLHFASEVKALRQSPYWDDTVSTESLEGYLSLGYFLAPGTIYRRVRQLEPGCWLRLRDGSLEIRRYWDIERFGDDHRPPAVIEAELEATLRQAVQDRLESEVPLGAFLSGGIDSGLVVSFMAEASNTVVTNSVGFETAGHSELEAAAATAARYGTVHHAHVVEPHLDDVLDEIVTGFDEPFADASAIPTYYVCRMARQHVTVALSGDGGDESFGGYDSRYVPHALESPVRGVVRRLALGRAVAALGRSWPRSRHLPRLLRLGNVLDNVASDPAAAYYADLCFLRPRHVRRLLGLPQGRDSSNGAAYAAVTDVYRRCPARSPVMRAQYADLKVYLPNDPLVKVDRMSMRHGLEVRCPLLDRRLVELAFRIPTAVKMPRLRQKYLLRQIAARRLPARVVTLPKRGFNAPIAEWLARAWNRLFESEVLNAGAWVSTVVDPTVIRSMSAEHRQGIADHSFALWAVWMIERWRRAACATPRPLLAVSAETRLATKGAS